MRELKDALFARYFMYVVIDSDGEPVGVFDDLNKAKAAADIYSQTQSYCWIKVFGLNEPCCWQDEWVYENWKEDLTDHNSEA